MCLIITPYVVSKTVLYTPYVYKIITLFLRPSVLSKWRGLRGLASPASAARSKACASTPFRTSGLRVTY